MSLYLSWRVSVKVRREMFFLNYNNIIDRRLLPTEAGYIPSPDFPDVNLCTVFPMGRCVAVDGWLDGRMDNFSCESVYSPSICPITAEEPLAVP